MYHYDYESTCDVYRSLINIGMLLCAAKRRQNYDCQLVFAILERAIAPIFPIPAQWTKSKKHHSNGGTGVHTEEKQKAR